jgi:hypothetical protein
VICGESVRFVTAASREASWEASMDGDAEASNQFPEDTREGRWMSYDEIGRIRGIGRASAVKLVAREKWRRTRGNDGTARAFVPGNWLKPASKRSREHSREDGREDTRELSHALNALGDAVAVLREQLEVANEAAASANRRAERAEQERDELRADIARAEERLRQAEIDRLVEAAARRSLFRRLWRGRGG